MNRSTLLLTTAVLTGAFSIAAFAQSSAQRSAPPADRPAATAPRTTDADHRQDVVDAGQLEAGANSFTEGQARSRIEDAGFVNVHRLQKDDHGFWRGRATRAGSETDVAMDFRGRIAAGPGLAAVPTTGASGQATRRDAMPAATANGRVPDGAPGNPPSTMTGRAVDRLQGETPRADGTPGNPPGTAVGRAVDRAAGTNSTGANTAAPATSGPTR